MRFHMLQNVQMALDFLRFKKIKLVNIRAEDIVDSKYRFQSEMRRESVPAGAFELENVLPPLSTHVSMSRHCSH
jgi:hypothetical protein